MKLEHRSIWNAICGVLGIMLGLAMTWVVHNEWDDDAPLSLALKIIVTFSCYMYGCQYLYHAHNEREFVKHHLMQR